MGDSGKDGRGRHRQPVSISPEAADSPLGTFMPAKAPIELEDALKMLRGDKEGVAKWNRLRRGGMEIPDLSGVRLAMANLRGAHLESVRLTGANLTGADLSGTNLIGSDLRGVQLVGVVLNGSDRRLSQIDKATFTNSRWTRGDLRDWKGAGARLDDDLAALLGEELSSSVYEPYPKELIDVLEKATQVRADFKKPTDESKAAVQAAVAALAPYRSPRIGDTVLNAELVELIGSGNFGHVYRAVPSDGSADIAVKVVQEEKLGLGRNLRAFRVGVKAMRRMSGEADRPPEVVELIASNLSDTAFAMTLARDLDLEEAGCDWPIEQKIEFFKGICRAVKFAHATKIRHRDIKPKNVLVTSKGLPLLVDFDIADLMYKGTMSTAANGTPNYAAPEQLRGTESRQFNADIYSLGRLLHYILTERHPPYEDAVPVLSDLFGQPEGLVRIIRRCTMRDPAKRYPRADDLLNDLSQYETDAETVGFEPPELSASSLQPTESTSKGAEPLWRNGPFMGVVGTVAVALIAGGFALAGKLPVREAKPEPPAARVASLLAKAKPAEAVLPDPPRGRPERPRGAVVSEKGGIWLARIPGGTFTMGSPETEAGRGVDEGPQHDVTISPFFMGMFEVTNEQYGRFLAANPAVEKPEGWGDDLPKQRPVVDVSWNDASRFARWAGARLPTEAEWEYAARAGTEGSRYGDIDAIAWHGGNSDRFPHAVGTKRPNAWGLYDMLGNAWELTAGPHEDYAASGKPDSRPGPTRPPNNRIIRGGSIVSHSSRVRAANRDTFGPADGAGYLGFRCARGVD